ncbi:hypothetical protein [Streptomyces sp. NBC_00078]|uniref:hypothetical protein n=1 Tax=unclassified Streptomyces TaxID=2593676 RepID=UPI0022535831|nr:hypothetical protein [Streptomyces sp. NBC_00078]MCX5418654.1 hypothetical protein [Streptomyces sp. NBC_00078]
MLVVGAHPAVVQPGERDARGRPPATGVPLGRPARTVFHREYERRRRACLGDDRFTEAVHEGRESGPDAAIAPALGGVLGLPDVPDL